MAKQVLIMEPQHALKFRGPFTSPVTSCMTLRNPTEKRILFKIKTTAPKKYCVRPNSGILEPNTFVEIAVCLQPFEYDPNSKNKHKFMVQSMIAPAGELHMDTVWKNAKPEELMDSKLDCCFEYELPTIQESQQEVPETKMNAIGDVAKTDGDPSPEEIEQLLKTHIEVKRLQEQSKTLMQENQQLREEIDKLRLLDRSLNGISFPLAFTSPNTMSYICVIFAILIAGFGFILSQYMQPGAP